VLIIFVKGSFPLPIYVRAHSYPIVRVQGAHICIFMFVRVLELDLLNGMHNGFIPLSFSKVKYNN